MIVVFKTSVNKKKEAFRLKPKLDSVSDQWNFDLSDCDRILRVKLRHKEEIALIQNVMLSAGFTCNELGE